MTYDPDNDLYDLVEKAQHGDQGAILQLILWFLPLIQKTKKYTNTQDKEDLEQHLIERFIHIVLRYDLSQVPNFFEYIQEHTEDGVSIDSYLKQQLPTDFSKKLYGLTDRGERE